LPFGSNSIAGRFCKTILPIGKGNLRISDTALPAAQTLPAIQVEQSGMYYESLSRSLKALSGRESVTLYDSAAAFQRYSIATRDKRIS
jgi:hypothetical protein